MIVFATNEEPKEVQNPRKDNSIMKAKVLVSCHIDGEPKEKGDIVDVDANTFRNLIRDGKLKAIETTKQPE